MYTILGTIYDSYFYLLCKIKFSFQSVFNLEDGKLVQYQKSTQAGLPDSVIVRQLVDDNTMTEVSL